MASKVGTLAQPHDNNGFFTVNLEPGARLQKGGRYRVGHPDRNKPFFHLASSDIRQQGGQTLVKVPRFARPEPGEEFWTVGR